MPWECPICQDTGAPDEQFCTIVPCGHVFHKVCVVSWFDRDATQRTCPTCRRMAKSTLNVYPSKEEDERHPIHTEQDSFEDLCLQTLQQDYFVLQKKCDHYREELEKRISAMGPVDRLDFEEQIRMMDGEMRKLGKENAKLLKENNKLRDKLRTIAAMSLLARGSDNDDVETQ